MQSMMLPSGMGGLNGSAVTPGRSDSDDYVLGGHPDDADDPTYDVDKINLTLSSGEDVDLSSLPVRVSCNEGDMPMMTPGASQKELPDSVDGIGEFPTDNNSSTGDIYGSQIILGGQKSLRVKDHAPTELFFGELKNEQMSMQQDSTRVFDSEREHATQLMTENVPDNRRGTIRGFKKQPSMMGKNDGGIRVQTKVIGGSRTAENASRKKTSSQKRREVIKQKSQTAVKATLSGTSSRRSSSHCKIAILQNSRNLVHGSSSKDNIGKTCTTGMLRFGKKQLHTKPSSEHIKIVPQHSTKVPRTRVNSNLYKADLLAGSQWQPQKLNRAAKQRLQHVNVRSAHVSPHVGLKKAYNMQSSSEVTSLCARNNELLEMSATKSQDLLAKQKNLRKVEQDSQDWSDEKIILTHREQSSREFGEVVDSSVLLQTSIGERDLERKDSFSDSDIFSKEDENAKRNRVQMKTTRDSFRANMDPKNSSKPGSRTSLNGETLEQRIKQLSSEVSKQKQSARGDNPQRGVKKQNSKLSKNRATQNSSQSLISPQSEVKKNKLTLGLQSSQKRGDALRKSDRVPPSPSLIQQLLHSEGQKKSKRASEKDRVQQHQQTVNRAQVDLKQQILQQANAKYNTKVGALSSTVMHSFNSQFQETVNLANAKLASDHLRATKRKSLQTIAVGSAKRSRIQSFKEFKASTFEYRASLPETSKTVEERFDSGEKSEDIGEVSPDVGTQLHPISKKVEVLIDSAITIQPFKLKPQPCPGGGGDAESTSVQNHRQNAPVKANQIDLVKFHSSKTAGGAKVQSSSSNSRQRKNDKHAGDGMVDKIKLMQGPPQKVRSERKEQQDQQYFSFGSKNRLVKQLASQGWSDSSAMQRAESEVSHGLSQPQQTLSLPSEHSNDGKSQHSLRHSRKTSQASSTAALQSDNDNTILQNSGRGERNQRNQPNESQLHKSVTKKRHVAVPQSTANRDQSPHDILSTRWGAPAAPTDAHIPAFEYSQQARRIALRQQTSDKKVPDEDSEVNKTIADKFTQRLTLDLATEDSAVQEQSAEQSVLGTRATLGTDYDQMRKYESNSVSPAHNADNLSEEPEKSGTTEPRKVVLQQQLASPNSVIFHFKTKPKRVKQSSDGEFSPQKRHRIATQCHTTTKKASKKIMFPQGSTGCLLDDIEKSQLLLTHENSTRVNDLWFKPKSRLLKMNGLQAGPLSKDSRHLMSRQRSQQVFAMPDRLSLKTIDVKQATAIRHVQSRVKEEAVLPAKKKYWPLDSEFFAQNETKKGFLDNLQQPLLGFSNELQRVLRQETSSLRCDTNNESSEVLNLGRKKVRKLFRPDESEFTDRTTTNNEKFVELHSSVQSPEIVDQSQRLQTEYSQRGGQSKVAMNLPTKSRASSKGANLKALLQRRTSSSQQQQQQQSFRLPGPNKELADKISRLSIPTNDYQQNYSSKGTRNDQVQQRGAMRVSEGTGSVMKEQILNRSIQSEKQNNLLATQSDGEFEVIEMPEPPQQKKAAALATQKAQPNASTSGYHRTTASTSATIGYITNQPLASTSAVMTTEAAPPIEKEEHKLLKRNNDREVKLRKSLTKHDEFMIYEDKAIQGWLHKLSKGYFTSWKRLYVVVDNQKLCYYSDSSQSGIKGVVDFAAIRARMEVLDEKTFQLTVKVKNGPDKKFTFMTQSRGSLATWVTIINLQMSNTEIVPASELQQVPCQPVELAPSNFWKVCRITSQELMQNAQTGDILLFTGKTMQDSIIRGITGSKYDHVGMLVKYEKSGQVLIFESLHGKGVSRWDWQQYETSNYWRNNYSKIVYRRLIGVERNEQFRKTVQEFMIETVGKPYRMLSNVLGAQDTEDHLKEKVRTKAGFFCSELIACCLKRLGLLDPTVPSTQYWPGQFSTENPAQGIQLLQDGFYSEEITVELQK